MSAEFESSSASVRAEWIDPQGDARWPRLLERRPGASSFHTRGWLEALRRTYGYQSRALVVADCDTRELRGGYVFCQIESRLTGRRLVSLPFSDHCDALVECERDGEVLLDAVREEQTRGRWKYVELRPSSWVAAADGAFLSCGQYYLHRLDLGDDLRNVFARFHRNHVVRKIRRSERERVVYVEGTSTALLDTFYALLVQTRRRHGVPPQPRRWFENIIACLPDAARIRVAIAGGVPIAAILTLRGPESMIFKYGASDARFHSLGGVHLLLWQAIQEAHRLGCRTFDFGRSDADNGGLIAFKDHWGAARTTLTYRRYPPRRNPVAGFDMALRRFARGFTRIAPDWLLVAGGRTIYRHLG